MDSTDKTAELTEALSVTARKVMRLPVLLPALLVFMTPAVLGAGVVARLVRMVQDGSLSEIASWGERNEGFMALLGLLVLACVPAALSGFASMAKAVVEAEDDVNGWALFWKGLGTYYWRIVGAYALLVAVVIVGVIFYGIFAGPVTSAPDSQARLQSVSLVAVTMGAYFFGPWIAVAVVEDTGVVAAAPRSARFAWKNAHVMAPAFVIQVVLNRFSERLINLAMEHAVYEYDFALPAGWLVGAVFGGALSAVTYVYFLVFRIFAYRRSAMPPPQPPEQLVEQPPTQPIEQPLPQPPVLSDEDQVTEGEDDHGEDDQNVPPVPPQADLD
ncbi:MAG: hypothetical protein ACM3WU_08860 [Bacillota bacterium]